MIMLGQHLVTENHTATKSEIAIQLITNLYDLHQMALTGLHVTQYMCVLFDKVNLYDQKPHLKLVFYVQKCIVSNKHPEKVQRSTLNNRNTHHKH